MNNLITTQPKPFADLELVPLQRQVPQPTGLEQFLAAMYRQRFVIAVALGFALLVGVVLWATSKPQYTAVASVQLDQQAPRLFDDEALDPDTNGRQGNRA